MSRDQIAFWQQVLALAYVRVTVSEGVPDTVQRLPPGMLRSVMVCADSEASFLREFRDREGLTHLETADIRQAFDHQCKAPARASRCSVAAGYTRGAWPLDRAIPCQHDRWHHSESSFSNWRILPWPAQRILAICSLSNFNRPTSGQPQFSQMQVKDTCTCEARICDKTQTGGGESFRTESSVGLSCRSRCYKILPNRFRNFRCFARARSLLQRQTALRDRAVLSTSKLQPQIKIWCGCRLDLLLAVIADVPHLEEGAPIVRALDSLQAPRGCSQFAMCRKPSSWMGFFPAKRSRVMRWFNFAKPMQEAFCQPCDCECAATWCASARCSSFLNSSILMALASWNSRGGFICNWNSRFVSACSIPSFEGFLWQRRFLKLMRGFFLAAQLCQASRRSVQLVDLGAITHKED